MDVTSSIVRIAHADTNPHHDFIALYQAFSVGVGISVSPPFKAKIRSGWDGFLGLGNHIELLNSIDQSHLNHLVVPRSSGYSPYLKGAQCGRRLTNVSNHPLICNSISDSNFFKRAWSNFKPRTRIAVLRFDLLVSFSHGAPVAFAVEQQAENENSNGAHDQRNDPAECSSGHKLLGTLVHPSVAAKVSRIPWPPTDVNHFSVVW